MKRVIIPALMLSLLCACGGHSEGTDTEFQNWANTVQSVGCAATVTMTQNEETAEFELNCEYTEDESSVNILAPESLTGISASRKDSETQLEYDGLILSLGELGGVTPASALPVLIDTIRSGHVQLCYTEYSDDVELLVAQIIAAEDLTAHVWLHRETMTPLRAEFESDGVVGIKLVITDWTLR